MLDVKNGCEAMEDRISLLLSTRGIVDQTVVYFVCSMVGSGFQSYPKDMVVMVVLTTLITNL